MDPTSSMLIGADFYPLTPFPKHPQDKIFLFETVGARIVLVLVHWSTFKTQLNIHCTYVEMDM